MFRSATRPATSITSWLNPTSVVVGLLAVTACAYLAAVYLVTDAHRMADAGLEDYFRDRAITSAVVVGIGRGGGHLASLAADDPFMFDGLAQRGWVFILLSGACGLRGSGAPAPRAIDAPPACLRQRRWRPSCGAGQRLNIRTCCRRR